MSSLPAPDAFDTCREVETDARKLFVPWAERMGLTMVWTNKFVNKVEQAVQFSGVDFFFHKPGCSEMLTGELKAEVVARKNLFFETYSDYPKRPGWGLTSRADVLFYLFVETKTLYVAPMHKLAAWVCGRRLEERTQKKHEQKNLTKGLLLPIADLQEESWFKTYKLEGGE